MAQMATEAVAQTVPLEGVVIVLPAGPHRVIRLADGNLCAVPEHLSPEEEQVVARQKSSDLYKYRQEAAEQEVIDISSCNVRVVAAPQESCEEQQDCVQEQLVDLDTSKQGATVESKPSATILKIEADVSVHSATYQGIWPQ
ncbi:unnamed protein product [Heligmosomoides polygyrus]|uniref:Zinc finger protein n=1 Tax=Heligmosomoides polygyrus TaxID=6339 RepID=A0A183FGU2_HELPZ|nr:unnamed protein product [Heligmosomoides polygyrus]